MNALISLYDKNNLHYLASKLLELGYDIFATNGTLNYLKERNIHIHSVEDLTNNPSGYENYFSSLSFNTLAGVLYNKELGPKEPKLEMIDLVAYNFVPTWETINSSNDFNICNVDLGGPTIVKAAAINYQRVIVFSNPEQYCLLERHDSLSIDDRKKLAVAALEACSQYDQKLSYYLDDN